MHGSAERSYPLTPAASLTAEVGIAVFRVTFGRCVTKASNQEWGALVRESLEELKVLVGEARSLDASVPMLKRPVALLDRTGQSRDKERSALNER